LFEVLYGAGELRRSALSFVCELRLVFDKLVGRGGESHHRKDGNESIIWIQRIMTLKLLIAAQ
jgi:hypothetical protein